MAVDSYYRNVHGRPVVEKGHDFEGAGSGVLFALTHSPATPQHSFFGRSWSLKQVVAGRYIHVPNDDFIRVFLWGLFASPILGCVSCFFC